MSAIVFNWSDYSEVSFELGQLKSTQGFKQIYYSLKKLGYFDQSTFGNCANYVLEFRPLKEGGCKSHVKSAQWFVVLKDGHCTKFLQFTSEQLEPKKVLKAMAKLLKEQNKRITSENAHLLDNLGVER